MRVKQVWSVIPIPAKLKLVYERVTFTRLTLGYFIFSFFHFIVQISIQIKAYTINADAAQFLWSVLIQGNAHNGSFPVFRDSEYRMCDDVPTSLSTQTCRLLWDGSRKSSNAVGNSSSSSSPMFDMATSTISSSSISPTLLSTPVITFPATAVPSPASATPIVTTKIPLSAVTSSLPSLAAASSSSTLIATQIPVKPSLATQVDASTSTTNIHNGAAGKIDFGDHSDDEESDDEDELLSFPPHKRAAPQDTKVLAVVENGHVTVHLKGFGYNGTEAVLEETCLWALNWPVSVLNNTKREDIVFIAFQFWVLGMSLVAILNESIPHILASLLTHILATSWAGFQISHTADFRRNFNTLITKGACAPIQLLPNYWTERAAAEIPSLALNVLALLVSGFLTWKLIRLFGWQTFKRVGASLIINRVYKCVLSLSISIQLAAFFIVVTVALWIDQLFNGDIGIHAHYKLLYEILFISTLIAVLPWLVLGWFSVRRELKVPMVIFLALTLVYMAGWGVMFLSDTFRWTFVTWRFFSLMAIASVVLTLLAFILGIVCRYNFGKGLPRYLSAHEALPGDDFVPIYPGNAGDQEKVAFPSNEKPIPTWSETFGSGVDVPPPRRMFPSAPVGGRLGPRFFNKSAEPFETQSNVSSIAYPVAAHTRTDSESSFGSVSTTQRQGAQSPNLNVQYYPTLTRTTSQTSSNSSGSSSGGKRWVIE